MKSQYFDWALFAAIVSWLAAGTVGTLNQLLLFLKRNRGRRRSKFVGDSDLVEGEFGPMPPREQSYYKVVLLSDYESFMNGLSSDPDIIFVKIRHIDGDKMYIEYAAAIKN